MESSSDQPPLIVIVGETASGKTALAVELAKQLDGEIIAADSRTLYKGMDIGTAKPTTEERAGVPHHLIDIATPDQLVTAATFKQVANAAIADVHSRGKNPFMVGGSGLYIDAVLYDFTFAPKGDEAKRRLWQQYSVADLQAELENRGIPLPANTKNPRHLIRQLETGGVVSLDKKLRSNTLVLGLLIDREELIGRIEARIEEMFKRGLIQEVTRLAGAYGWDCPALETIGYKEFKTFNMGIQPLSELKSTIRTDTLQYAKRQRTWFKRNKNINWITKKEEAVDLITTFLNK